MQVSTLSPQWGPGSQLVDWYRCATSVSYGFSLVDLSPRADDSLLLYKQWIVLIKIYNPDQLKHLKSLDDKHTKLPYTPIVPIIFLRMQSFAPLCKNQNAPGAKNLYPYFF